MARDIEINARIDNSALVLRAGAAEDADCVGVLAMQVFLDTYATEGIRPDLAREVLAGYSPEAFRRRLAQASSRFVLAERSGHLAGFAEVALDRPLPDGRPAKGAELVRLYVQGPFHRQGVGTALLRRAEQLAAAAGEGTMWLTAWEGNHRAVDFWRRRGFQEYGTTVHTIEGRHYGNCLFTKRLTATDRTTPP